MTREKKRWIRGFAAMAILGFFAYAAVPVPDLQPNMDDVEAEPKVGAVTAFAAEAPAIVRQPLPWSEERERLTQEYAQLHYGMSITEIVPQAVVVHWTAGGTWQSAYYTFYDATRADGQVNVSSQFVVDRDGTIYLLTPEETTMGRHVIGYNWCAIGIENVGGIDNAEDLTPEQLEANAALISYLHGKYPTIRYVFGHYQQTAARASGLYIEHVDGYYSLKSDPGPIFMRGLRERLSPEGLVFFDE